MTKEPHEPIIESMLDEMLGQRECPDFVDRVRAKVAAKNEKQGRLADIVSAAQQTQPTDTARSLPLAASTNVNVRSSSRASEQTPASSTSSVRLGESKRSSLKWLQPVIWMACGAASVIATLLVVDQLWLQSNRNESQSAERSSSDPSIREGEFRSPDSENAAPFRTHRPSPRNQLAGNNETNNNPNNSGSVNPESATDTLAGNEDSNSGHGFSADPESIPFDSGNGNRFNTNSLAGAPIPSPRNTDAIVTRVNFVIDQEIRRQQIMPLAPISFQSWLDRCFVVLLGRNATATELAEYSKQTDTPAWREQVVDSLLTDEKYRDEFSRHWANKLANDMIPVSSRRIPIANPSSPNPGETSKLMTDFLAASLSESLKSDEGLDKITHDLLTASGSLQPDFDDYNPSVAFVMSLAQDRKQVALTDQVAGYFLGRRLDCARCHDHVADSQWGQEDYWQFNGFFRQIQLSKSADGNAFRITDTDFGGDNNANDAAIVFEAQDGRMVATYPTFGEEQVTTSGRIEDVNRRAELADRVVQSEQFRRVMVNRIWAHVFGVGMTRPIDDFEDDNAVSHPVLIDSLSGQWAAHDFQLRPLLKWLVLSRPFTRPAEPMSWQLAVDAPRSGHRPLFSQFYWSPDEELSTSKALGLIVDNRNALANYELSSSGLFANQSALNSTGDSTQPNQDLPSHSLDEMDLDNAEKLANSFLLRSPQNPWGVSNKYSEILDAIVASDLTQEEKVTHIFLTAISREPNSTERRQAQQMLGYRSDDTVRGLQDIWWALMLSSEFAH